MINPASIFHSFLSRHGKFCSDFYVNVNRQGLTPFLALLPLLQKGDDAHRSPSRSLEDGTRSATEDPMPEMTLRSNLFPDERLIPKSRIKPRRSVDKNSQNLFWGKKIPSPNLPLQPNPPPRLPFLHNGDPLSPERPVLPSLRRTTFQT